MVNRNKAVFLDRDGVLNRAIVREGKPYPPSTIEEFEILPGVPEALWRLRAQGFRLHVVTNQPDVARGTQSRSVIEAMNARMRAVLPIDGIYVCYHDSADVCECRKPKPGLVLSAAAEHGIALQRSYMVGDRWRDVDCGHAAGCTTIFIDRHYQESLRQEPHLRASDLAEATKLIISREEDYSNVDKSS